MSRKRGQITIFILIGVLVIIIAGLAIFFLAPRIPKEDVEKVLEAPMKPVKLFVESCIENVGKDALELVGIQGGYIWFPIDAKRFMLFELPTAYWYYEGQDFKVSTAIIEDQIGRYVNEELLKCTADFEAFAPKEIVAGEISSDVTIYNDLVAIKVTWPVELREEERVYSWEDYSTTLPVRLGRLLDDVGSVVDMELILNNEVDLTYLGELEMDFDIYRPEGDILVYGAYDLESQIEGVPYVFVFANKFILTEAVNNPPQITNAVNLTVVVGQTLTYDFEAVDADGDVVDFSVMPDDIMSIDSETGVLSFTPTEEGEEVVDITVTDEDGLTDIATIIITITGG